MGLPVNDLIENQETLQGTLSLKIPASVLGFSKEI